MKPTLFITLGGTGIEITHRVRRRILTHRWGSQEDPVRIGDLSEFPLAQFIYYDLDVTGETRTDMHQVRFRNEEQLNFKLNIDKYLLADDELSKYPHIASWMPVTPAWIRKWIGIAEERANNHMPTAMPRFFSRLYFFDKYHHLKSMINSKIRSLLDGISNRSKIERLGLEMEPASVRVVAIASTAGCTGSGSFLDMGYLVKWLAGKMLPGAEIDLVLMLPSGYGDSGHGKARSEANTYAALMELETCMGHGNQLVSGWTNSEHPDLPRTPYDDVFLFDIGNLAQKTAKTPDLFEMVADILFEDFMPTESSSGKNAIRVCHTQYKIDSFSLPVDARKYGKMKMMYSRAYSAFGQSIIDPQLMQQRDENSRGQVNEDLITMLEKMPASNRRALFQHCLETAMPWVEANLEGSWTVNPDQYSCVIGVGGARIFEQKFGDEFKSATPESARMLAGKVLFFESGVSDKLTCYVELSGLPLTALKRLPNWRESYEEENKKVPVHIHKDRTLFVHPLAPSVATLDRLAEHFKLYIQGIVSRVLKLRRGDTEAGVYSIEVAGEELSIGNERIIRLEGLSPMLLGYLQTQVTDALHWIKTPAQYAWLVALYDYYTQRVYPPAIIRYDLGYEYLAPGFANVMCANLREEARKKVSEVTEGDVSELVSRLADTLDLWTDEIEGSETDVYENEVGKSHMPKRILIREFFQAGWLGNRFKRPDREEDEEGIPPAPQGFKPYKVAIDGKSSGPFDWKGLLELILKGKLTSSTKVWRKPMSEWQKAGEIEELSPLLENDEPPLTDDDEPPLE